MSRLAASLLVLLVLLASSADAAETGRSWAVLVGIDRYQRPDVTPLLYAVADARALARELESSAGFRSEDVFVLTSDRTGDEAPTRLNVVYRLDWLAERVGPEDTVLFFFAGHGIEREGASYLLTVEADPRSQATLEDSSLGARRLNDLLHRLPARRLLVLVDACRNDPRAGRGDAPNPLGDGLARDLAMQAPPPGAGAEPAFATLLACSRGERSYEWPDRGHGFFTWFLVEGLQGRAADPAGRVTVRSLADYLEREVPRAVERVVGARQVPWIRSEGAGLATWALAFGVASPPPPEEAAPPSASADLQEGWMLLEQEKPREAFPYFERALRIDSSSAEAHAGRGAVYRLTGELEAAIRDCTRALELDPACTLAWYHRGTAYALQGKVSEALRDLDEALRLDPGRAGAHLNRGLALVVAGRTQEAMESLSRAIQLDPRLARAYSARGIAHLELGDFGSAVRDLTVAVGLEPQASQHRYQRGRAYLKLSLYEQAAADLDEAIRTQPEGVEAYVMRALARAGLKRFSEALEDANRAVYMAPQSPDGYVARGTVYYLMDREEEALRDCRQAVRLDPGEIEHIPQELRGRL